MKMLTPEEIKSFREGIAEFGISDDRKDDLIRFLDAIVVSFVSQAFRKNSVQLSLSARANYAFNSAESHANLRLSDVSELVDPGNGDAINTTGPLAHEGRHLAP